MFEGTVAIHIVLRPIVWKERNDNKDTLRHNSKRGEK